MNLRNLVGVTGLTVAFGLGLSTSAFAGTRQMEALSRGLVSANVGTGMLVSWRLLGTEKPNTQFNLYRDGTKIATIGEYEATNYLDASGSTTSVYTVAPVNDGVEGAKQGLSLVYDGTYKFGNLRFPYKTLSLDVPAGVTTPDGTTCTYTANDMSTGDVDGDGELELILKWDPSNSHDNSASGYSGNVYIDAYKLDGTKLWRIDLGKNIRAGAHYTQFMVYDFDGDGYAEIAMKTSDGTVDGMGNVIGDASKDYRSSTGTIMSGNEYLTIFQGATGAALKTIDYWPARGKISGDTYGNRDNRMLAAVAYLDGVHPSLIMCRGYYTEAYVAAYDWDGTNLTTKWQYSGSTSGQGLYGQGNHNLSVGDVDSDGKDEIIYGAGALDHDGTFMYRTGLGHGDAMHLSDMDPDRDGLEVWDVHEDYATSAYSDELHDARTGAIIWGTSQTGGDNGRGLAADLDSTNRGFEMWSYASGSIHDAKGNSLWSALPSQNFRIYFDEDLQDELLDATGSGGSGGKIEKWNQSSKAIDRYFSFYNVNGSTLNNSTKGNPCIVADLLGDWREEFIARSGSDASIVTIFSTPVATTHRLYTLMHDAQYRLSIAWQNVAYNQPPHAGYYLPDHADKNVSQPDIYTVAADGSVTIPAPSLAKNGAGSSRQTITLGDSLVDFAYAYKNCTGATVTGLPNGVTSTLNTSDMKIYIKGTPTEAGTFAFTVTTTGGTGDAATMSGTITVTDPNAVVESSSSSIPEESSNSEGGVVVSGHASQVNAAIPDEYDEGSFINESSNTGWLESGYFNSANAVGSYGTWELYSKDAGETTLTIRFANGGQDPRNMTLTFNGESLGELEFESTDGWTSWYEKEIKVTLVEGKNTITLTSTSANGGPNIDLFYFDQAGVCLYRDYESGAVTFEESSSSAAGENSSSSSSEGSTAIHMSGVQSVNSYNFRTGVIRVQDAGLAEIYAFDMLGNMRLGHTAYVSAGESVFGLDASMLPKGSFLVKVKFNGKLISASKVSNF